MLTVHAVVDRHDARSYWASSLRAHSPRFGAATLFALQLTGPVPVMTVPGALSFELIKVSIDLVKFSSTTDVPEYTTYSG